MVMVEQDHNYRIDRRNSKKPIGDVTTIYGDWRASPVTKDILSKSPLFTIRGGGEGGGVVWKERRVPEIHQYQDISNHALQDRKDTLALHMVLVQLQFQR